MLARPEFRQSSRSNSRANRIDSVTASPTDANEYHPASVQALHLLQESIPRETTPKSQGSRRDDRCTRRFDGQNRLAPCFVIFRFCGPAHRIGGAGGRRRAAGTPPVVQG